MSTTIDANTIWSDRHQEETTKNRIKPWYKANMTKHLDTKKKWYEANLKEAESSFKATRAKWYEANQQQKSATVPWYEANLDNSLDAEITKKVV